MTAQTTEHLARWISSHLAESRGLPPSAIDVKERFTRYALDSLGAAKMIAELSKLLGRPLSPTLVWEHPTIESLARALSGEQAPGAEPRATRPTGAEPGDPASRAIAVVGMACRLPSAPDPASFWRLLRDGRSAVGEAPQGRWPKGRISSGAEAEERAKVRRGGFLASIDGFDPLFFGISPREAVSMDPQQRLMMELCWEALEDAGIPPHTLRESLTGVFAGAIWSDYGVMLYESGAGELGQYTITGYHHALIANRISYFFGLQGPSFTIDSACSSGLVVTHLACDSLRRGESQVAVVGAVNLNVLEESAIGVSRFGALSPDGRCYTFDARANGYVRGEGGGVVILKTLSRAIADGDRVYCVIRGSAVNNDGPSNGLTAPNPKAQEELLRTAYARAGVGASEVHYLEAHGTGTPLGDPIEARAIGAAIGRERSPSSPLLIGSAKTNVGHLEGAAGMVGLIKVAQSIRHRLLPPSLNFESPNPHASLDELHLAVQTALTPWPEAEQKLTAGVSSFGLGGTNGHVVLQEWPGPPAETLVLSAPDRPALLAAAEAAKRALDLGPPEPLADTCARAAEAESASRGAERLAVVARSHDGLRRALATLLEGGRGPDIHLRDQAVDIDLSKGVVFVFPGQGAQWHGAAHGMAATLLQSEPVVRDVLVRCDAYVRRYLGVSLLDELVSPRAASRLGEIEISLPAIISIDIAMATWLRSLGVTPAAVVGHSTGEIAAAYVAGALDLEDTMKVICAYGTIIGRLAGRGGMALVGLPWDETEAHLAGYEGRVFRAIQDSAEATVLAGEPAAIEGVLANLRAQSVFCRNVAMNVSPHCPLVDGVRGELFEAIAGIRPRAGSVPLFSEVTGDLADGASLDPAHWVKNFGDPAFFSNAVDALIARGHRVFVDVGPHPITKHSVETNLRVAGVKGRVLTSMRRDEDERAVMLDTLGELFALGAPVDYRGVYPFGEDRLQRPYLVPLSARSRGALTSFAEALAAKLDAGGARLRDVAYTSSVRRTHHDLRAAVVGETRAEVAEKLRALAAEDRPLRAAIARPKVVFVFPGQGSQWVGMGRELMRTEPTFRDALSACEEPMQRLGGFSLAAELAADEGQSRLSAIDVVQPALFAMEIALAALLRSWGVEPDCVIGHSMGEVAAAFVAGALSLEDACKVICRRSKLLKQVAGSGAMGLVELGVGDATRELSGYEDRLSVAVSNGPRSTVISGDPKALEEVLSRLEARGVFCRRVKVDVASHSPQMDPLRDDLHASLLDLIPRQTTVAMRSTVTGEVVDGASLGASYWVDNLRRPVLFSSVTQGLIDDGHDVFIELSPHPILLPAVEENLAEKGRTGAALPAMRRSAPERRVMLETVAALYARGGDVAWDKLFPEGGALVDLPHYPWQRERCWIDARTTDEPRERGEQASHPLLGAPFSPADRPEMHYWERRLHPGAPGYLIDHKVAEDIVFPGAGYVELGLAAAAATIGAGGAIALEGVTFVKMMPLAAGEPRAVQVALAEDDRGGATIEIASRESRDVPWVKHAKMAAKASIEAPAPAPPSAARARCATEVDAASHYSSMAARKIVYGPAFRGLSSIWVGQREAIGLVRLPEAAGDTARYGAHPALLDACFQLLMPLLGDVEGTFVPVSIERVFFRGPTPSVVWAHATLRDEQTADLVITREDGEVVMRATGLTLQRIGVESDDPLASCAYKVVWRPKPPLPPPSPAKGTWLLFVDEGGVGAAVAARLRDRGLLCIEVIIGWHFERCGPWQYMIDPMRAEGYQRLFREVLDPDVPCRGVVHLWSLDAERNEGTSPETLHVDIYRGGFSVLHVVQELVWQSLRDTPNLWIVTRGAQDALGDASVTSAAQAPVWGMGRTIAMEQPDLACCRLDLDPARRPGEVSDIVKELLSADGEDQVALRGEQRLVARLTRDRVEPTAPPSFDPAATYLITGGLGGLGLAAAAWMASRGAKHLTLIGRSAPNDAARATIRDIESAGARADVLAADVSKPADVERVMAHIDASGRPLKGLIHAAGVLDDRTLPEMGEEQFLRPIRPKIYGAFHLHEATRRRALDFFVMYSSAASLLGSPGQSNYAAANAYLDALAHARAAEGLPAAAIQWGAFSDVGLAAAQDNRGKRLSHRGVESFTPDEGVELLSRTIAKPATERGLVKMSVRQWIEFYPHVAVAPFFSELRDAEGKRAIKTVGKFREALLSLPKIDRRRALTRHVLECLDRVLRVPADKIDVEAPFRSYGMDSLMSLEIRNRLESSLGLRFSAALLFTYPTTAALVDELMTELGLVEAETSFEEESSLLPEDAEVALRDDRSDPPPPPRPAPKPKITIVDELSEETAVALLDEKLLDLEDFLNEQE